MSTYHPKMKFACFYLPSPTFIGVYMHFDSYMLLNHKFSLVSEIIFCGFTICSDMPKFHQEICNIKYIFIKSGYSQRFVDKIQTAEKKQVTIVLPYMGIILTELKVKLCSTLKQLLRACDLSF